MQKILIAVLATLLLSVYGASSKPLAADTIYWSGDAETGDLSQWQNVNECCAGRITVVTSPIVQGKYAYRFQLNDGDTIFGTERVMLSQQYDTSKYELDGQEKWYGWSVMLPADYPFNTSWSLVVQWKGIHTGSPPIQLSQRDANWQLTYRPTITSSNTVKWKAPVHKGQYDSFVMHVKWSTDPAIGFIEFWYNGILVVPLFHTANIHVENGQPIPNFIAMGLYRDSTISTNVYLYHDGMTVGNSYAAVTGGMVPVTDTPIAITSTWTNTPTKTATRTPTLTRTPTNLPVTVISTPTKTETPIPTIGTPTPSATVAPATATPECHFFIVINRNVCIP